MRHDGKMILGRIKVTSCEPKSRISMVSKASTMALSPPVGVTLACPFDAPVLGKWNACLPDLQVDGVAQQLTAVLGFLERHPLLRDLVSLLKAVENRYLQTQPDRGEVEPGSGNELTDSITTAVVAVIGKKGGNLGCRMGSIVVRELSDRKQISPVVLLVIGIHAEVAFQGLIRSFCLTISLRMVGSRELKLDV